MSHTVRFYNFAKKVNSTVTPSSGGTSYSCVFKEPTSLINPILNIDASSMVGYNYAYIPDFNRYYFIDDVISVRKNFWEVHLSVDALASFKGEFLPHSQYVLRAAAVAPGAPSDTTSTNSYIPDSQYPMTKQTDVSVSNIGTPFDSVDENWGDLPTYVFALVNNSDVASSKINGVQYLQLDRGQARAAMKAIFDQDYFGLGPAEALFGITPAVIKSVVNPAQYISKAYVLPFKCTGAERAFPKVVVSDFKLGWWDVPLSISTTMYAISGSDNNVPIATRDLDFHIGVHPQASTHGAFLNYAPYTEVTLYAGPFGTVPLNVPVVGSSVINIRARVVCDFQGNSTLYVKHIMDSSDFESASNVLLAMRRTNVAIDIPLVAGTTDTDKSLATASSLAVGALATGGTSLALSGSGIVDCISSMAPKYYINGGQSSDAFIREPWYVQVEHHYVSGDTNSGNLIGKPLCDNRILSNLQGYCKVQQPTISISGTKTEAEMIETLMSSGFFIEV